MAGYKIDELKIFANGEDTETIASNVDNNGITETFKEGDPIYPKPVNYVLRTTSLITKALLNVGASTDATTSILPNMSESQCLTVVKEGFDNYVNGHINSKIKSEKGNGVTDVMSQKTVTDELNGLDTRVTTNTSEIAKIKNGQTKVPKATQADYLNYMNQEWTKVTNNSSTNYILNTGYIYEIYFEFSISTISTTKSFIVDTSLDSNWIHVYDGKYGSITLKRNSAKTKYRVDISGLSTEAFSSVTTYYYRIVH